MQQLAFNNSIQNLEKAPSSLSRSPVKTLGAQNKNRRNKPLNSYPAPPPPKGASTEQQDPSAISRDFRPSHEATETGDRSQGAGQASC